MGAEGVQSAPFRIAEDIYREPFRLVTRAMHLWRCGIDVHAIHNGREYRQKACHLQDGHFLPHDDKVGSRNTGPVPPELAVRGPMPIDATGGWHDAGDYNKYVVNAGVTVGCMLMAWEMFQSRIEMSI